MQENNILFRNTADKAGRNWIVTPENSDMEVLSYGRIILNSQQNQVAYANPDFEAALICLHGSGTVTVDSNVFKVSPYDTIFLPPGNSGNIKTDASLDLLESAAPSDKEGEPVLVSFEQLKEDEVLSQTLSSPPDQRQLYRIIDDNVPAQRLLCGIDFSKEGNWTSWAPHEHAQTKEEIYIYFDMPEPAFGIQMIYEDLDDPDFIGPVREDDAVTIKRGYHPNVAVPGHPINFVWIMATLDPSIKRSWGDVNTQPEFAD
jgi:5-deoxy-glucuronate isomerase